MTSKGIIFFSTTEGSALEPIGTRALVTSRNIVAVKQTKARTPRSTEAVIESLLGLLPRGSGAGGSARRETLPDPKRSKKHQKWFRVLQVIGVRHLPDLLKARHEAGHVVVGVFLGHDLTSGVRLNGEAEVSLRAPGRGAEARAQKIKIALAGPIAEQESPAEGSRGWGSDIPNAIKWMKKLERDPKAREVRFASFAAEVREILTQEKKPLDALTRMLAQRGRLTEEELRAELHRLSWPPAPTGAPPTSKPKRSKARTST